MSNGRWVIKIELMGREETIQMALKRIADEAAIGNWDHMVVFRGGGGGGDPIGFSQSVEIKRPDEGPLTEKEIRELRKLLPPRS